MNNLAFGQYVNFGYLYVLILTPNANAIIPTHKYREEKHGRRIKVIQRQIIAEEWRIGECTVFFNPMAIRVFTEGFHSLPQNIKRPIGRERCFS